jgi:hypothetical protein
MIISTVSFLQHPGADPHGLRGRTRWLAWVDAACVGGRGGLTGALEPLPRPKPGGSRDRRQRETVAGDTAKVNRARDYGALLLNVRRNAAMMAGCGRRIAGTA